MYRKDQENFNIWYWFEVGSGKIFDLFRHYESTRNIIVDKIIIFYDKYRESVLRILII